MGALQAEHLGIERYERVGFSDAAPLRGANDAGTPDVRDGIDPRQFAALALVAVVGLFVMASVLFISFNGHSSFSTPYGALRVTRTASRPTQSKSRTARFRPVIKHHSDVSVVHAAIERNKNGVSEITSQPFRRIETSLATVATTLSEDIPDYDRMALLAANAPITAPSDVAEAVIPEIYDLKSQSELKIKTSALPLDDTPKQQVSDLDAEDYLRTTLPALDQDNLGQDPSVMAYAPINQGNRVHALERPDVLEATPENLTVVHKTLAANDNRLSQSERVVLVPKQISLDDALLQNGFTEKMVQAVREATNNILPKPMLPKGAHLRILYGVGRDGTAIPYRLSIYFGDKHAVTIARTDSGRYVLGMEPPKIDLADDTSEKTDVSALPSLYRAIWEAGRKYDLPDDMINRIIAMFVSDTDMTQKVDANAAIDVLETTPDDGADPELLYVKLKVDQNSYERFGYRNDDGSLDYYDKDGRTSRPFLIRRPLQGGGRVSSPFGWRVHPVFHKRILHTGVDLAAPYGSPIYAAGDGVVARANKVRGYGRLVELTHADGYSTRYAHMSKYADGLHPGEHVHQGQVIGYIGTSGVSTGPHVHFEIRINGRPMNPLSVKLPDSNALAARDMDAFDKQVSQIHKLMQANADAPTQKLASAD